MLLGSLLLYFVRFGYDYGNSDQDEIIPFLLNRLDPGLFTQDWFVQTQVSEFSVRTYFVWLISAPALILPVWLSVLLIYVAAWLFIAAAVYKLAYHFTGDQIAASGAVVLGLVLTPVWTLGGNDLVHGMLVASMVAWALGLWAVYHFLRSRYLVVPVLLGVSCWIQALVGLHLAMLLFLVRVIKYYRGERGSHTLPGIIGFGLLFALWSSPALGPIINQQLLQRPPAFHPEPSLFYILAEFRLPHHYLPASFRLHDVVRFVGLAVVGTGILAWKPFRVRLTDAGFIIRVLVLIACFCTFAALFTELIPVLPVAKLQLFKMTVLAKLFFVIVLCGAVAYLAPRPLTAPFHSALRRPGWSLAIVSTALATVIAAAVLTEGIFHEKVGPFRRAEMPLGRVQEWAQHQTRYGAIFSIPPSISSFRSEALRTIVINYKAIPFDDEEMVTWFERLTTMAPIELPERGGPELPERLDRAYESLDGDRLRELSTRYGFDYVLRKTPMDDPAPFFSEVYDSEGWLVYDAVTGMPADSLSLPEGLPADSVSLPERLPADSVSLSDGLSADSTRRRGSDPIVDRSAVDEE